MTTQTRWATWKGHWGRIIAETETTYTLDLDFLIPSTGAVYTKTIEAEKCKVQL